MKIGIDVRILQETRRGQGRYVYYLVKHLLALGGGDRYRVLYNGFRKGEFAFEESPYLEQIWCRLPGRILKPLWSGAGFPPAEVLMGDLDVFHAPFNFNFTHYTPIPSRAPLVATFNGIADPYSLWPDPDVRQIDRWLQIIAERSRLIIAVSAHAKADLLERVRIPGERVRVIPYGVSDEFAVIGDRALLQDRLAKYGLAGKRYILYVGTSEPNKNLAGLVRGFREAAQRPACADLTLVLAGPRDDALRRVAEEAAGYGLTGRVVCTGFVDHSDLPLLYNGAELFVLPSFVESFGIPLLEAMACGVPVIASSAGGMPEVVGDAGVLFDPADARDMARAMVTVLDNRGLREELREKGLRRARAFTWTEVARKTAAVYREAAGEAG